MRVIPGQPLDGTGIVCIHLFVQDECGPFVEPHALHVTKNDQGAPIGQALVGRATRGRLACDPKRSVEPTTYGGVVTVTPRTDDPRAVSCPKCIASKEHAEMMAVLTNN